jgi:hypothetical protein
MDLNAHRQICFSVFEKYLNDNKLISDDAYKNCIQSIWLGNWLTDMNQATALFSIIGNFSDKDTFTKTDYYDAWDKSKNCYVLPRLLSEKDIRTPWERLIKKLWDIEWNDFKDVFKGFSSSPISEVGNSEAIGCYYPYDHFDITDDYNGIVWTDNEKEEEGRIDFYRTPLCGIDYAFDGWIIPAFQERDKNDVFSDSALRKLGHGLHILQDFFAHTNFVELLLLILSNTPGSIEQTIADNLIKQINIGIKGTFTSFPLMTKIEQTPVMSGRFDTIDTLYTLAGSYKSQLIKTPWNSEILKKDNTQDNLILFIDTFSYIKEVEELSKIVIGINEVNKFLSWINTQLQKVVVNIAFWVAEEKLKNNPSSQFSLDQVRELVSGTLDSSLAMKNYQRAGKLMFLQTSIEEMLEKKIRDVEGDFSKPHLPHHTLLAKDRDVLNHEVQLAYKIACSFASEITYLVIEGYFNKSKNAVDIKLKVNETLTHPSKVFANPNIDLSKLETKINTLYSGNWWQNLGGGFVV